MRCCRVHAEPLHALRHDLGHVRGPLGFEEGDRLVREFLVGELADRVDEAVLEERLRRGHLLVPEIADDRPGHRAGVALLEERYRHEPTFHRPDEIGEDRLGRAAHELGALE